MYKQDKKYKNHIKVLGDFRMRKMTTDEVKRESYKRAKQNAKEQGGMVVPVYSVVETDADGRIKRVTHEHLNFVDYIEK